MRKDLLAKMAIGLCCLIAVSMCSSTLLAQTSLYSDTFETYTTTPDSLLGQNGWTQGAWGTGTSVDVRSTTGITGSATNAARLDQDGNSAAAAVYKAFSSTAVSDGAVDVYVDMKRFCDFAQFCVGDSSMELGLDSGNLDSSGTGARFGFRQGKVSLYSNDTLYDSGVSTAAGTWYQFHATLYPSISSYSLEVLDNAGNVIVGNNDWFDGVENDGLMDLDLFSYQNTSTGGLQNLGLLAVPVVKDQVAYMDNIDVSQNLAAAVPVVTTQNLVYQDSFEAEEFGTGNGYGAGNLATQQGWQAGAWGGDATLTVKTAYAGSSDGTQAVRLGGTPATGETSCAASIYKTVSDTSMADGSIDFTFDLKPFHGTGDSSGFVTLGDANMTLGDLAGELDATGIAAMVGMQEDSSLVLFDGDTIIDSGYDLASGAWYQVHVIVFPEDGTFAVEVPGVVGFDGWVDDEDSLDYDLFTFRDETVLGIENLGFLGSTQEDGSPVYLDNISLTHYAAESSAVPEPGVVTLLLSALLLLGALPVWRKRSNR